MANNYRKRFRPFDIIGFDDIFSEIESEFERMQKYMEKTFMEMEEEAKKKPGPYGPFVYGFSIQVGSDGKPIIHEFGNTPKPETAMLSSNEMEPLVEVRESDKEISVIAELPGVEKKDINLEVLDNTLIIDVNTHKKKYYKEIVLPRKVKEEGIKASYKNGVLEVKCEVIKEEKKKGNRIHIE